MLSDDSVIQPGTPAMEIEQLDFTIVSDLDASTRFYLPSFQLRNGRGPILNLEAPGSIAATIRWFT